MHELTDCAVCCILVRLESPGTSRERKQQPDAWVTKKENEKDFRRVLWSVAVVTALLIAWITGGNWLASREEASVNQFWLETTGLEPHAIFEGALSKFPPTEGNQVAGELEAAAIKLGMADKGEIPGVNFSFLHDQLRSTTADLEEPPEVLRQFLLSHQDLLKNVYALLSKKEIPRWRGDLTRFEAAHYPNKFVIRVLERVMALDILERTRQDRHQEAWQAFQSLWNLNESMSLRPELLVRRMAVELAFYPHGVLRKMNTAPAEWSGDLLIKDYRHGADQAFALEASLTTKMAQAGPYYPEMQLGPLGRLLFTPLGRSILRFQRSKPTRLAGIIVSELQDAEFCTFDPDHRREQIEEAFKGEKPDEPRKPWPDLDPTIFYFNWKDLARATLDLELSQKILQLKELEGTTRGATSVKDLPTGLDSALCADLKWVFQVSEGIVTIQPEGLPSWIKQEPRAHWQLPLTYSMRFTP